jgi:phage host-nuclease inhibitor protein Gam
MARTKPSNLHPVKSLDDANEALREIGELKRIIAAIEDRMNDDIDVLKASAKEEAAHYRSRLEALENGVYAFAEIKKDELFDDNRRSVTLDFGSIGYRRSHEVGLAKGFTWKAVLAKLRELLFKDAIRVKEEPDKDILKSWPAERLALVGCVRKENDTFWLESDEVKLTASDAQ